MRRWPRYLWILIAALGIGAVFWQWTRNPPEPVVDDGDIGTPPPIVEATVSPIAGVSPPPARVVPNAAVKPLTFDFTVSDAARRQIERCYPESHAARADFPLDELVTEATRRAGGIQSQTESIHNYHVDTPQGRRRIQLIADSPNSTQLRLRLYSEDREGLPVKIDMPEAESTDPSPQVVQKYLAQGQLVFEETYLSLRLRDGSTWDLIRENGHAKFLRGAGKSGKTIFSCEPDLDTRVVECLCEK